LTGKSQSCHLTDPDLSHSKRQQIEQLAISFFSNTDYFRQLYSAGELAGAFIGDLASNFLRTHQDAPRFFKCNACVFLTSIFTESFVESGLHNLTSNKKSNIVRING
jgi:hypothetical protein